jgi:type I restriction enzyme S subunit
MKKPWERAPLDEAVFLQEGPGIRSYEYQKGGYPMINVRCVQDGYIDLSTCNAANVELATGKWKHFQVQEGDILFTISGSIGRTAVVKKKDLPLLMNTSVVRFRSKTTRLRDDFFFYYLQSEDFLGKLHALSSGTAQKNVGPTHLKTLDVPLPPLTEQQRIVGLLDEAFEGLATAKANAEKNLQNARALFESHLQTVFTQRGPLALLSDLADEVTDGDHSPPPKAPTGVPFITISDIDKRTGTIDFSNTFTVPDTYFLGLKPSKKPRVGDVLYTVTGATLGIPILVREQRDFCFQRHIGLIRPNATTDSSWLTYALRSPQVFRQATIGSTGAAQKTVSLGVLRNLQLPKVKLAEQKQIATKLDSLSEETQRLARLYERKHAALEALKKSLLHQAFTGAL